MTQTMTFQNVSTEVLEWSATEAVSHIHNGSISAERYASQLLQRCQEGTGLNAFISIDEDRVLESARAVDVARAKGRPLGPLAGLPIAIKDNINTAGYPTTAGVAALKNYYPPRNARIVDALLDHGAIALGKASMDELGREFTNSNEVYGFARNPYDPSRVPGGGAGGTAVAISARMTPAGLGSDTAGSARIPAAFCGIVGLRPSTAGRLRGWTTGSWTVTDLEDGVVPIAFAVTTPGPMGRTVSDAALLHAVVTGGAMPPAIGLRGTRLGVPKGFFWEDLDPEVARVSECGLQRLRDAGAILIDVDLRQWAHVALPTFLTLATMHAMQDLSAFLAQNGANVTLNQVMDAVKCKGTRFRTRRMLENPATAEKAEAATRARLELALEYDNLFEKEQISALVYPTVPVLPPPIRPEGDDVTDTIELNGKAVRQFDIAMRNTHGASVIGVPALSIPAGLSSSGLPVGLSLSARANRDGTLLGLALSVEDVLGRLPAPRFRTVRAEGPPADLPSARTTPRPPVVAPGSVPSASDNLGRVLALLKQSAYVSLYGRFDAGGVDRSERFAATGLVRRYDIDFRLDECGPGLRALNLLSGECGGASLRWTFPASPVTAGASSPVRPFTMDDLFVFDSEKRNQLRGTGLGQLSIGDFGVRGHGNLVEGTGVFAGVQGGYVLTGNQEGPGLNLQFTMRLMDPQGVYQTSSDLLLSDGEQAPHGSQTTMAFLGEPDPAHPVELQPTGAIVNQLLRPVHTAFDRGWGDDSLRSTLSVGPIVARWRTQVIFNPKDPNAPGTAERPMPVRLEHIAITFLDAAGTLDAGISDGHAYIMTLPGVSGPLFRMTGFGAIAGGTGRFRDARGGISMLGSIDLSPAAFANCYLLHLVDPDGRFRC
jgi:Asp-tRNA(Asn)/Glu-tRNA(Gln) amidotransferase A subunit family amidase